jgi:hypothetical protein
MSAGGRRASREAHHRSVPRHEPAPRRERVRRLPARPPRRNPLRPWGSRPAPRAGRAPGRAASRRTPAARKRTCRRPRAPRSARSAAARPPPARAQVGDERAAKPTTAACPPRTPPPRERVRRLPARPPRRDPLRPYGCVRHRADDRAAASGCQDGRRASITPGVAAPRLAEFHHPLSDFGRIRCASMHPGTRSESRDHINRRPLSAGGRQANIRTTCRHASSASSVDFSRRSKEPAISANLSAYFERSLQCAECSSCGQKLDTGGFHVD